jgi:hypothetical protein
MTVSEMEKEQLSHTAVKIGAVFSTIGVLLMLSGSIVGGGSVGVIAMFIFGLCFCGFGVAFLVKGGEFGELYVAKKRSLTADKDGIVWVWIVALLTWAIMAIAYFSLSMVVYMVLDSVEAFYPWGSQELGVIALTRNVCAWFLVIMTVGIIGWALINSVRKVDDTAMY